MHSWLPDQGVIMLRTQWSQPELGANALVKQQRLMARGNNGGYRFSCSAHIPVVLMPLLAGPAAAVPPAVPVLLHVALVKVHVHKPPIHLHGAPLRGQKMNLAMQQHSGSRLSKAAHIQGRDRLQGRVT